MSIDDFKHYSKKFERLQKAEELILELQDYIEDLELEVKEETNIEFSLDNLRKMFGSEAHKIKLKVSNIT